MGVLSVKSQKSMSGVMVKKSLIILLILSLWGINSYAGTNGGYSGAFLRLGLGARALGMGNAQVAVAQGPWALYYNPGALPWTSHREIALTTYSLSLDREFYFVGAAIPLRPHNAPVQAGVALGWIHTRTSNIDGRDFDGNHYGWLSQSENAFQMAFGLGDTSRIGVGLAVKVIYSLYPDMTAEGNAVDANGVGMDVGARVRLLPMLTLAARIKDFNFLNSDRKMRITWDTSEYWTQGSSKADLFPVQFVGGAAVTPLDGLTVAGDAEISSAYDRRLHFGAEYSIPILRDSDQLQGAIRAGVDYHNITFGLGITPKVWHLRTTLDYAYIIEAVSPIDSHIFSWTFQF
jgi:hypothetical protein